MENNEMPFPPNYHSPENQRRRAVERYEKKRALNGPLNIDLIKTSGKSKATFYRHQKKAMKPTPPAIDDEGTTSAEDMLTLSLASYLKNIRGNRVNDCN
jgi:hypothetical protein